MKNFTLKFTLVLLLGVGLVSTAAAQKIGGLVKDATGNPVVGASVIVEGTTLGASSGVDGKWTLSVPDASKKTLSISYIGMQTQQIAIGNRTTVDVTLQDAATSLDDVVVVGYATMKRRDVVGSISSVSAEALSQMPVASVAEAMTGRMAGVAVSTSEGDPDAEIKIRVRGGASISQDSSPLLIVDGFPVESISDIPASDIQSVDVLKDAFSTAIYGSRGANGVVIVTTKSGQKGKISVNYNLYVGFKDIARKDKLAVMDVSNFVKYQYEIAAMRGAVAKNYEPYFGSFSDIDLYDNVQGNDWMDQLFGRSGEQFNHNLSISGGGDKFKWTASYAHLYDKAIMVGSSFNRDNLNLKASYQANKRVSFDFSIRYSDTKVRGAGANSLGDAATSTTGRLRNAILYTPIPISGQTSDVDDPENSNDAVNPLTAVYDSDKQRRRTEWNANAGMTWEIVDNLRLKVEAGLSDFNQVDDEFYGLTTYQSRAKSTVLGTPSARYSDLKRKRIRSTNTLAYDFAKVIGSDNHHLNLLVGQEYIVTTQNAFQTLVDGLPTDFDAEMAWHVMGAGSNVAYAQNTYAPDDKLFSFFGRVNYDFKSKYFVSATMRADASSRFSKGHKWGYFPSAAVSWRLSGENFLKDVQWIDNLKLRYSFGTAGNNNIPSGVSRNQTFAAGTDYASYINGVPVYWTAGSTMANSNLTWETTLSHNIGLDFSFWKDRLNGSVEVYQNNTRDLLIKMPIQGSGYQFQYRNAGETRNRGVEVSLGAALVRKKNFGLNFNANISFNQNRVMKLVPELDESGYQENSKWNNEMKLNDYVAAVGSAVGDVMGYTTVGRYEVSDFDLDYYAQTGKWRTLDGSDCSIVTGDMRPGALRLLCDEKGAPVYGVIGNVQPKFTGGFSLSGYAYGFDLAANFTFSYGNKVYNANKLEYTASHKYYEAGNIRNLLDVMSLGSRWTNVDWSTGELITDPAALAEANASTTMWSPYITTNFMHSWALEDASFLRLSSLTLGYTLPTSITRKIRIEKIRIYATGTNLFCWTPYTGADPEVDTRRSTPMTPNVDYSGYPKSRAWVFGINISF